MKSSRLVSRCTKAFIVFGLIGLFFYYVRINFDESRYIKPGSLDYYLLIDSVYVENMPIPEKPVSVMYHYSVGDGHKSPSQAIFIKTKTLSDHYRQRLQGFIKKYNLQQHKPLNTTTVYKHYKTPEKTRVTISISREKDYYKIKLMDMY